MPIVIAPDPEPKPSVLERAQMRAFKNLICAAYSGHRLRAAFWAGVLSILGGLRH